MNIALYFGSFNPVHHGHLLIASHVSNFPEIDQVWLVVSPQNPLKIDNLLSEYDRLFLCKLAVEGEKKLRICDAEFHLPKPSYTIDTLIYLKEKFSQHNFSIVLGSDSFQNLPKWKNFELLIAQYSFLIYQRPNFIVKDNFRAKHTFLNAPLLEISATEIRNLIKQKKSIRYFVPENVREEIEKSGFYKRNLKNKSKRETN